jgi:hypothetical protein
MKWIFLVVSIAFTPAALAQVKAARGGGESRIQYQPRVAPNPASQDTTPLNCSRPEVKFHPHQGVRLMCERWERHLLADSARRAGRPAPSDSVIRLPSLGSDDANATGFACIGGQAFQKIPNGWNQVMSPAGGWQRCEEG